mmetsp:Transcript_5292/g.9715  ORF Transcript_5292/g.9715 Transcript_5292/m.9715 type:complete len:164 (+) Transcript_5292:617-1108(+)
MIRIRVRTIMELPVLLVPVPVPVLEKESKAKKGTNTTRRGRREIVRESGEELHAQQHGEVQVTARSIPSLICTARGMAKPCLCQAGTPVPVPLVHAQEVRVQVQVMVMEMMKSRRHSHNSVMVIVRTVRMLYLDTQSYFGVDHHVEDRLDWRHSHSHTHRRVR